MKPLIVLKLLACLLAPVAVRAQLYSFSTLAGRPGLDSADGTNQAALLGSPYGVAVDNGGNIYVADCANNTIRKVSLVDGASVVTTIAGQPGVAGWTDGTNGVARFRSPMGIAVDAGTNVYVADTENHLIRKLTPSGTNWVVTTLAGGNQLPHSGYRDGPGVLARFFSPSGIAVDSAGTLYVADTLNNAIRQVTPFGGVTTIAGRSDEFYGFPGSADGTNASARFRSPQGIVLTSAGDLYVADRGNHTVRKLTRFMGNWVVTTLAGKAGVPGSLDGANSGARFNSPAGLDLSVSGEIIVADRDNQTVRTITLERTNAVVRTLAGLPGRPGASDGTTVTARFSHPQGVAVYDSRSILVADANNAALRIIVASGTGARVLTVAGSPEARRQEGAGLNGRFWSPHGIVRDKDGTLYVADTRNHAIRSITFVSGQWIVLTVAGLPGAPGANDGPCSTFGSPVGLAVDQAGDLYVADTFNHLIRKVAREGTNWVVTTLAGSRSAAPPRADGTNSTAHFCLPQGIAAHASGSLFVADTGNHAIRKMSRVGTNWVVTTIAGNLGGWGGVDGTNGEARFNRPSGIVVAPDGSLFVADTSNGAIRKVTPVGTNWVVTTVAGSLARFSTGSADGTNNSARFSNPSSLCLDDAGNLFVADTDNSTVRKITPSGTNWIVTTVAGLAGSTGTTDGVGASARFRLCWGVAVDPSGGLFVTDSGNDTIRFGQPSPAH